MGNRSSTTGFADEPKVTKTWAIERPYPVLVYPGKMPLETLAKPDSVGMAGGHPRAYMR